MLAPNLESIPEDAANDALWAADVARSIDVFVLDGVRASCESSASVISVPRLVAERGAGMQVTSTLEAARMATLTVPKPYTLVLGGTSVARVLPIAKALLGECTDILVGGPVGNTFLVAQGWRPAGLVSNPSAVAVVDAFLADARNAGVTVHSPPDVVMRTTRASGEPTYEVCKLNRSFLPEEAAVDVAIETCAAFGRVLLRSASALWVGLMGDCSVEETQSGSLRIAQAASRVPRTVIAGDDTIAAIRFFGFGERFQMLHGGDAALPLLAGASLPGLEAIRR